MLGTPSLWPEIVSLPCLPSVGATALPLDTSTTGAERKGRPGAIGRTDLPLSLTLPGG